MERQTRQREAIEEAIQHSGRPLSPREIHAQAAAAQPGLNIATVYRTLKEMVSEERLKRVELPGEAARYEMAGKAHHHHFHCRRCDKVFELAGCGLERGGRLPRGFRMQGHEVVVWGLCDACNGRRRATPQKEGHHGKL